MQTSFLQRQVHLMLAEISSYSSGVTAFNVFFQNIKGLLFLVKAYDEEIYEEIDNVLFNMESSFAIRKYRGNLDEEEFRYYQKGNIDKIREIVIEKYNFD